MLRKLSWDSPSRGGCPNCPSPASTPNLYPDGKNFPGATNGILPPNPQITSMFYSNGWMLSTDDKNFPVALMGFSHQSCDLQFAPTLTLPSPRCHDNKQRKTLLHFDMEVFTWWDLFLKSYIFLGLGDQEAARSELRGPQVLGRVHLFGCRQVVFLFLKRRRIAEQR